MTANESGVKEPIISELVQEDASFADIVVQFIEGLGDRIAIMEDALRAADFEALRGAAHQLKGSGGGYGYPILTKCAAELERNAKAHSLECCAEQLEDLRGLCSRVVVGPEQT